MQKNRTFPKSLVSKAIAMVTILLAAYSCASIGRPDGGPYDETPPRFVKSSPEPWALNTKKKKISIEFDEFIVLEKANEKVVVSPPQGQMPEIKASGKHIIVNLLDTLKPSTTYTIDFSDAIVDNNEANPLGDFTFSFSTGSSIDTMEVSGTLLNAADLEPIKGMLVGLQPNLADSAFTTLPLERVARTDSRGHFIIKGVAPGKYHIFGLSDADANFYFSQKSEAIAFSDSIIVPHMERRMRQDTAWIDTLTYDSIVEREYTHFLPDDIILRAFSEPFAVQYLKKYERLTPEKISLYFAAKADSLPTLKGLNFDEKDAFVIESSQGHDTLHYWIKDSLLYQQDTLAVQLDYLYTDTLNQLVPRTDTLQLVPKRYPKKEREAELAKEAEKRKKRRKYTKEEPEEEVVPTEFLTVKTQVPGQMNVYDYISLTFPEPVVSFDTTAIHINQKVDSLWKEIPFEFEQDSLLHRKYNIYCNWTPTESYEMVIDSTAVHGLYGLFTDKIIKKFKVRSLDEYGTLFFNITGADSCAFVELLNKQDKVVRKRSVVNGRADFYFLSPGIYGARLVNDRNNNGKWDTGDYATQTEPEEVFYYPQLLEIRVLMEFLQDWDIHEQPLNLQKPNELKKQKPDEPKKKNREKRRR